jgi:hypothetical protein
MIGHGQLTFISEVVKYSIPILIAESKLGKIENLREPEMLSGKLDTIYCKYKSTWRPRHPEPILRSKVYLIFPVTK